MVHYVRMPKLTELMASVKIGKWLKKEGENVREGEPLCEVESEKATEEIPAMESGILRKITAPPGAVVDYDEVIAVLTSPGEELPDLSDLMKRTEEKPEAAKVEVTAGPQPSVGELRVKISPVARKMAEENKVDITKIKGTGPEGRIVREDVVRAIEETKASPTRAAPPSGEEARIVSMSKFRQISAERLTHSARTSVPAIITVEVDMESATKLHDEAFPEIEKKAGVHLSYTDLMVKAVAKALADSPVVNSRIEGDQIKTISSVNVGVAVAAEEGLVVPVIHNADKMTVTEISVALKGVAEKARQGKLSISDGSGGTFTISNLGMFGVDSFTPIINPPESAILGVGKIVKKLAVIDNEVEMRSRMILTLVFDHRAMDGAQAAQFLGKVKAYLEQPLTLMLP